MSGFADAGLPGGTIALVTGASRGIGAAVPSNWLVLARAW